MFEVTFLGTGTALATGKRVSSGLAVKIIVRGSDESLILIDSGAGILHNMGKAGLEPSDITDIFYTHTHPDHVCDLVPILFSIFVKDSRNDDSLLRIHIPPGSMEFFSTYLKLFGKYSSPSSKNIIIDELDKQVVSGPGWSVERHPLVHTPGSSGFRLTDAEGTVLAVSGDTEPCSRLTTLALKADLAVFECSFPDHMETAGHLTPASAAKAAAEAGVKSLALVHRYPDCDKIDIASAVRKYYRGRLTIPEDCNKITVHAPEERGPADNDAAP